MYRRKGSEIVLTQLEVASNAVSSDRAELSAAREDWSDAKLISEVRAGSVESFVVLWERYRAVAIYTASGLLSYDDVQDVVSEAYVRIFDALQRDLGPTFAFRSYLIQTVRNCAIRVLQQSQNLDEEVFDEQLFDGSDQGAKEPAVSGSLSVENRELIFAAYAQLPQRMQEVLWCTEVEGLTARAAAAKLGIPAAQVSLLSFRARAKLRELWFQSHLNAADVPNECRPFARLYAPFLAEKLAKRPAAAVEEHLAGCTNCRDLVSECRSSALTLHSTLLPAMLLGLGVSHRDALRVVMNLFRAPGAEQKAAVAAGRMPPLHAPANAVKGVAGATNAAAPVQISTLKASVANVFAVKTPVVVGVSATVLAATAVAMVGLVMQSGSSAGLVPAALTTAQQSSPHSLAAQTPASPPASTLGDASADASTGQQFSTDGSSSQATESRATLTESGSPQPQSQPLSGSPQAGGVVLAGGSRVPERVIIDPDDSRLVTPSAPSTGVSGAANGAGAAAAGSNASGTSSAGTNTTSSGQAAGGSNANTPAVAPVLPVSAGALTVDSLDTAGGLLLPVVSGVAAPGALVEVWLNGVYQSTGANAAGAWSLTARAGARPGVNSLVVGAAGERTAPVEFELLAPSPSRAGVADANGVVSFSVSSVPNARVVVWGTNDAFVHWFASPSGSERIVLSGADVAGRSSGLATSACYTSADGSRVGVTALSPAS